MSRTGAVALLGFLGALMIVVAYATFTGGEPIAAGLAVGVLAMMAWEARGLAR